MRIHFVGIGGIGLSAIAKFMQTDGHLISGSDIRPSKITEGLVKLGMNITIPHDASAIDGQDIVIYTAAAKPDNVELVEAARQGLKILSRSDALKLVLEDKKVYSVCGAHGKSTTTAMLASIMGCSTLIGAESKEFDSNARAVDMKDKDDRKLMVFEADESDGSFLNSNPYCSIVTNAEPEHMEYYGYDFEKFYGSYNRFLQMAKKRVINAEDEFLGKQELEATRLFAKSDIKNIRYELLDGEPSTSFELQELGVFSVWGFGEHIALDASLAILAALNEMGVEEIRQNLKKFKGLKKRFDILTKNSDFALIDDYAHHPTEIEATIKSAKLFASLYGLGTITAIWQPHKWSRTFDCLEHFQSCFLGCDRLVILPVWAVNELPGELDFKEKFARFKPTLYERIRRDGDSVWLVAENENVEQLKSGLVIGFGAGDITYQLRGLK